MAGTAQDVTQSGGPVEQQLGHQANFDALTGHHPTGITSLAPIPRLCGFRRNEHATMSACIMGRDYHGNQRSVPGYAAGTRFYRPLATIRLEMRGDISAGLAEMSLAWW